VPAGTQPETQFRLRGEGFPRLRGRERGDMIVLTHIDLPDNLTAQQRDMIREAFGSPAGRASTRRPGLFGRR
ncbi:MAG TPA: DnaJ C-terminal domain-containing protein, partial [Thermoplasmata archaeon]|nr:DnaJ C-terminal domain-containing protein [Thermoplasmata archaeon]